MHLESPAILGITDPLLSPSAHRHDLTSPRGSAESASTIARSRPGAATTSPSCGATAVSRLSRTTLMTPEPTSAKHRHIP